jgi:hypothetical protein
VEVEQVCGGGGNFNYAVAAQISRSPRNPEKSFFLFFVIIARAIWSSNLYPKPVK